MFKLFVIFAPARCVGFLSAVLVLGFPGVHVAHTLRYLRFMACPPQPSLEFKQFFSQNRSLARLRRTCTLQITFSINWIGPWRTRAQKSALLKHFLRTYFGNDYNHLVKLIGAPDLPF